MPLSSLLPHPLGSRFLSPSVARTTSVFAIMVAAPVALFAIPVASDDSFMVEEDGTLSISGGGILVSASFGETGAAIGGTWDYLDRLENENGAAHSYPVDGSGQAWNSVPFDPGTSTIGPWSSGPAPLQGGTIDGFDPGTPDLLAGLAAAGNGENLITTYLFRHDFILDAAAATEGNWVLDYLFDDGGIVYLNGMEIHRTPNMPAGPVATTTLSGLGDELNPVSTPIDLTGKLVEGNNSLAVEVHQTTWSSSDVGMTLSLRPAADSATSGFTYSDDTFNGTALPDFAIGNVDASGGFDGAALFVQAGGRPGGTLATSGGWSKQFTLEAPATVTVSFRFRLVFSQDYEDDEFGEALFELDGTRYGDGPGNSLAQFTGNGNGGGDDDTDWQLVSFDIPLTSGDHTMVLGAHSSKSTSNGELTRAWFDDVEISIPATGGGVLVNDSGDSPIAVLGEGPTHGTLILNENGSFLYRPASNYTGPDSFTYRANDANGDSNLATVTLTVTPVNDPPIARSESYPGAENQATTVNAPGVLQNDSDLEGDDLTAVLVGDVTHGTLQLSADGSFTYTPQPGFFGTDTFSYLANDGADASAPVPVTIEVAPINDPPVAVDDEYITVENSPISITLSSGIEELVFSTDFDAASVPLQLSGAGASEGVQGFDGRGPAGNTFSGQFLRNSASGDPAAPTTLTLTGLPPHQSLSIRFLLAIIDSWDGDNDDFIVTVDGVEIFNRTFRNTGPNQSYPYPAGSLLFRDEEAGFTVNGTTFRDAAYNMAREPAFRDIPHTASTATISWFASGGNWTGGDDESWAIDNLEIRVSAAPVETLVATGATWTYLDDNSDLGNAWRAPGFDDSAWASGPAQLGYGDGDEATVVGFGGNNGNKHITTYFRHRFEVTGADEFGSLVVGFIRDDGGAVYLNGSLIAIDNLDPGAAASAPANLNPGLTYENVWNEFTVPADLLVEGSNVLAVEIHQDDPGSSDISMDLYLQGKRIVNAGLLANDTDPEEDRLTTELVSDVQHGTLTLNPDGTFLYTPDINYEGPDSFTYRANDSEFQSEPATVFLTMTSGPNDLPVTMPETYPATEDTPLTIPALTGVLSNDTDPDSPSLTATLANPPANGSLVLSVGGGFTYTPHPNFAGTDTFTYLATDGIDFSPPELVTITVAPINDPPSAAPDEYLTPPGQTLLPAPALGVLANDFDPDNPSLAAILVSGPSSGALNLSTDGSFSYAPNGGFSGTDTFTYEVTDGTLTSGTATVTIRVNSPPVAADDQFTTAEDNPIIKSAAEGLLFNDTDADLLTVVLVTNPANGTLTLSTDGSFIYVPDGDFHGSDSFTYRAADLLQESQLATVTLSITPVNDEPRSKNDSYDAEANQLLTITSARGVLSNDIDLDGPPGMTAVLVDDVVNGTLNLAPDGSFSYQPDPGFTGTERFTYEADDGSDESGTTTVTIEVRSASSNIVINEIMFHPSTENDLDEYIELTNIGTTPVTLTDWKFTSGVDFTFPAVTILPGEFLVVAADTSSFETTYDVLPNVIGNWTGKLSNSGENIRLVDQFGQQVDEVHYYDQGDWASRIRITDGGEAGWSWVSAADAQGSSLELIHPGLSNKQGQNWAASLNNIPTPTAPNSTAQTDIAPLILDVKHVPTVPTSSDPIGIVAELRDDFGEVLSATLHYRVSASNPGPFAAVPMFDDGYNCDAEAGDDIYGHMLPPMPDGTIIEFYVESSDGTNTRTWPAPASDGQTANALLQVDDEANTFDHGFYRIILPVPEYNQWQGINRGSNAMMNATAILDDGSGPKIRYLAGMRVRGAGSRSHTPAPMRVALPRDQEWNNFSRMNLNTRFTYLQFLGMKLFQASGMRAPDTYRVQVRINGINIARNDGFDHGSIVHVQPLSGEFIDDKYETDNGGNLYKKVRPAREFRWRNGNIGGYESDGWSKETNRSENDWSDLDSLLDVINNASGDPDYLDQVEAVADVDQWMSWFATMAILANGETNISNGADDDFSMYRGELDPRFAFVPHDLDTILSFGDGSRNEDPAHTIFDMIEDDDVLDPLIPFFQEPSIITRYYQALRTLLQTSFSEPEFNELLENSLRDWVPDSTLEQMRGYMDARREFIEGEITPVIGAPTPLPLATSSGTVDAAHGALYISEVLAINDLTQTIDGIHPDAIELHNSGPVALQLGGMSLSDDPLLPDRFVFPQGTSIPSGGYLLVWGGDPLPTPGLYTGFTLDGEGETLSLYDSPANGATLVDAVSFGIQIPDYSIGRTGPGTTTWRLCEPTLGGANVGVSYGDPSQLRINEWMSQHAAVFRDDFIELYNPGSRPVALGSLFITDEPVNYPAKHQIADLSFIAPNGFSVLYPVGSSANPVRADELPFRLSSNNEWIALSGSNEALIDQVHFVNQLADISRGRIPDGGGTYRDFVVPTPGFSNSAILATEELLLRNLRISEIMYDPFGGSGLEFIELKNIGPEPINLAGVRFTEGIRFDFPDMILQPGEFVLVVSNLVEFEALYGAGLNVAGQYTGRLNNGGERIRLEISSINAGIHDFAYDNSWFPATDGAGFSLDLVDLSSPPSTWGDKQSWSASLAFNGTPSEGGLFTVRTLAPESLSLPEEAVVTSLVGYGPLSPASATFRWHLVSGPAAVTFSSPGRPDTAVSFPAPGIYTLRLDATATASESSQTFLINVYDSYPAWILRNFGAENPAVTDKDQDPDLDGVPNLFEFALLMDPNVPDAGSFPNPVLDPGDEALTLTYSKNFIDPTELAVIPEVSSDLFTWRIGSTAVTQQILADNFGLQIIRAVDNASLSEESARFMRLRVICPVDPVPSSGLKILSIGGAPGQPAITFTSEIGQRYELESTTDPRTGWTTIGSPVTAVSTSTTLFDQTAPTDPIRLYRVRQLP